MRVVWTEPALDGIRRAYQYLFRLNPQAAARVADSLRNQGDLLQHFPYRGRPVQGTTLRELVADYPYILRYRIVGEDVVILRVRHAARRPTKP